MKTIVVTGATGHLGFNLVRELLDHGYHVRAGVHDLGDVERTAPLRGLDVELIAADLDDADGLRQAMRGAVGVFQLAASTRMWARDPQREIIGPHVRGLLNVLDAAAWAGVSRVVMTSSVAAIGSSASEAEPLTEASWNENPRTAYAVAKTVAEKRAWEFAAERGLDLVAINPSSLIGPGYFRHTPISWLVEWMVRGLVPVALPSAPAWVDVRDVAAVHRLAFENAQARGRYLVSTRCLPFGDLVNLLHEIDPKIPSVKRTVPAGVLWALAGLDYLGYLFLGLERRLTGGIIEEFLGAEMHCSSAKATSELGWTPRALEETLGDTVAWIRDGRARVAQGRNG